MIDGVQVLALQVLDERHGERGLVRQFANDDGHRREPREPGRPPTALAGDDLVGLGIGSCVRRRDRSDDQRLENALLTNRFGELAEALFPQLQARLIPPRLELVYS